MLIVILGILCLICRIFRIAVLNFSRLLFAVTPGAVEWVVENVMSSEA